MKIRRITIEVEVPWPVHHETVLTLLRYILDRENILNQEQIISTIESPNTRIGV